MADRTKWLTNVRETLRQGVEVKCAQCGRPFRTHHVNGQYCSQACRNAASKQRKSGRPPLEHEGARP